MSTPSQSELFLNEAFDLIGNTTIIGLFSGVVFVLYCLCAQSLYLQLQEPDKGRQARFTLGYITLIFFFTITVLALSARMAQLTYVEHADFPGGPINYEKSYNPTTNSYETTTAVFSLIVVVLTMAIQIWRLWVVWSGTKYASIMIVLPLLLLLSFTALDVLVNIVLALMPLDQLGISYQSAIAMETAAYAVLPTLTLTVTVLIATRLFLVRRCHIKVIGMSPTSGPYLGIVAMLVESFALESVWSIGSAVSVGLRHPSILLFGACDSTVKVIAYFLVVYRVSTGRGWTAQTGPKLTSLQWNHDSQTTIDEVSSSAHSEVPVAMTEVAAVSPTSKSHYELTV